MNGDLCAETAQWRMVETLARALAAHARDAPGRLAFLAGYAREIAAILGWSEAGLRALRAASVLHDAGELAMPVWVGGPSQDERSGPAQWSAHALVGAGMLESMGFRGEAAAMVRAHHEHWDGSGRPKGLGGESIPEGARVLAVADCLALRPLPEALEVLRRGAGTIYDPRLVAVVERNHRKMERAVRNGGRAPGKEDWLEAIASAAHKSRLLYELTGELGSSLSLHETLAEFDSRLRKLADYHAMAVWTPREDHLAAAYVSGKEARWLCSLEIPYGQGLSGRVAETLQAVRNGDPREEGPCPADGAGTIGLRSAMAAPLEHHAELAGVLTLYHGEAAAFREEDLGLLLSIRKKLAAAVANALKYESAERLSTVDPATSLPNERALFLRLDAELARCRRNGGRLAVLACEVEGIQRVARRPGLLQSAAAGLRRLCREEDCVARMGDRFVLVLCNFARRHLADKQKRIEALLAELSPAAGGGRPLTAKVGAAFSPEDGGCAEDLLAVADLRINLARESEEAEAVLDEARS